MADVEEPVVTPPAPGEPKVEEPKKEAKSAPLDPKRPLSQQVGKILDKMGPEDDKEVEGDKAPEGDEPKKEGADGDSTGGDGDKEVDKDGDVGDQPGTEDPEEPEIEPVELPPVAKYIYDNLPQIQTIGHVGEGKDKVVNVKTPQELPEGFEFADKRTELIFNAAVSGQEINARELQAKYQQNEQKNQIAEYQAQEAKDIQSGIQTLQREGVLPKFKYTETDDRFNDDPAVKEANSIYDVYKRTNEAYIKSGQTYRISFVDAADKYYATQSRLKPKAEPKPEVKTERDRVAAKVGAPAGATTSKDRPKLPPGTSIDQVYQLYKRGQI